AFAAITGHYPDGNPYVSRRQVIRSHAPHSTTARLGILHGLVESDDGMTFYLNPTRPLEVPVYACNHDGPHRESSIPMKKGKLGLFMIKRAWSVPTEELDHIVVGRLFDLIRFDAKISNRIELFCKQQISDKIDEAQLLAKQIQEAEAQIRHLDRLLT